MTDIQKRPTTSSIHTTTDARKRLIRRYATERRFKWIGFSAVILSGLFLVLLLATISTKAFPTFTQFYVMLPVDLSSKQVDPQAPQNADYDGILRHAIRDYFPEVNGRSNRRLLSSLISPGAGFVLRSEVLDDKEPLGETRNIPVLLDDFSDLYFKGLITGQTSFSTRNIATPTGTSGVIEIHANSNAFADILSSIKQQLNRQAEDLYAKISGLKRSLEHMNTQLNDLETKQNALSDTVQQSSDGKIEKTKQNIIKLQQRIDITTKQAKALSERANSLTQREQLNDDFPSILITINGGVVKARTVTASVITGDVLLPLQSTDEAKQGEWSIEKIDAPQSERKLSDKAIVWLNKLRDDGRIEQKFNSIFFTHGASREPEIAGILGALVGSFYTMLVTLLISFPLGVSAAIYLEEFAPKNHWTQIIEVNINNLAAVPSIVFGLLGLAVFLSVFGLPRSAPLVGGMVLALMTFPTIIIAARAALRAVPPSIREAALGIGASKIQTVFHHVLPLAMPGILTGTIIGMAQALGETAPLLMIGMVAFIVDIPNGLLDPATVLPVQIYMWSDFPEVAFTQKTSAAILVLLGFLIAMNAAAVFLRKRFERRW